MAKKKQPPPPVRGYQVRGGGVYGTMKLAGKSYVSPKFTLDWLEREGELQAELGIWRAQLKRDLLKAKPRLLMPKFGLTRDMALFLRSLPEGSRKRDLTSLLEKWRGTALAAKPRDTITPEDVEAQLRAWQQGRPPMAGSTLNHLRQALIALWCGL